MLLVAAVFEAPLLAQANPGMSPNPAKAPWYFMGLQELLVHLHPAFAVFVVPLLAAALLVALPFLRYGEAPSGAYFHSRTRRPRRPSPRRGAALLSRRVSCSRTSRPPHARAWLPSLPPAVRDRPRPPGARLRRCSRRSTVAARGCRRTRLEAVQALFTFVVVAFVVLTVIGSLFRGQGMALAWPWAAAAAREEEPVTDAPREMPEDPPPQGRRGFLALAWKLLGVAAVAEFLGVAGAYLWPRGARGEPATGSSRPGPWASSRRLR